MKKKKKKKHPIVADIFERGVFSVRKPNEEFVGSSIWLEKLTFLFNQEILALNIEP